MIIYANAMQNAVDVEEEEEKTHVIIHLLFASSMIDPIGRIDGEAANICMSNLCNEFTHFSQF